MQIPQAVSELEKEGLELTDEGLKEGAHLFGRLWRWADSQGRRAVAPPNLTNTDGEPILLHAAAFSVSDEAALRSALARRPDVEADEDGDKWTWSIEGGRGAVTLGDRTHLGMLNLIGDEIVLDVNSAARFRRARAWLEKIPGVAFKSVRTRDFLREDPAERPLDERISPPRSPDPTPEMAKVLQEHLRRQYLRWLDESIPALGGLTPREACKTGEGRKNVEILIRTIPNPMGSPMLDMESIKKELLSALGLGTSE
jgi:hypothetical protein